MKMKKNKFDIIYSLGRDCYCAMYMKKHGLRLTSGPFDWLTNADFETRMQLIKNDFDDFLNIEDLTLLQKDPNVINDDLHNYYENTRNHFYYYHDFPINEDFETTFNKVKRKYDRRIERFLDNLRTKEDVLLIWFSTIPYTNKCDIKSICNSLCEKFNKKIYFLIIEHDDAIADDSIVINEISENIVKYSCCTFKIKYENGKKITERQYKILQAIYQKYKIKKTVSYYMCSIKSIPYLLKRIMKYICKKCKFGGK